MRDTNGRWYPRLSPKQIDVLNDNHQRILLSGPRACGKSIVALHKAVKHAWMYPNDRVGIFVKSTKIGKTGVWDDLQNFIIPEWCEGLEDEGFKVVRQGQDGSTRMCYIVIQNMHGGESELQLHPLHHEDSVSEKLKGSRFGCMLWDEIDAHENEDVFRIAVLQLRQIGLPAEKHLWIGTCNPAGDTDHWLYRKFWIDINNESTPKEYRDMFYTFEFKLFDNPYLAASTILELKQTYKDSPELYDRYVNGLWVPDTRMVHFAGAFRQGFHVKGDTKTGEYILPTDTCAEIIVGWDIGDRNHAVAFYEHVIGGDGDYWTLLDEVVHIGEDLSIETLTYEVMAKMDEIDKLCGGKVTFKHWSDRSAFDRYRSAADARDHILVNQFSDGRIVLIGCPKPPRSVQQRLSLIRQMLIGNRLFISANCERMVAMMKKLSKGKTKGELIRRDEHIHSFDAMSYPIYGESIDQIEDNMRPKIGSRPTEGFSVAR